MNTTTRHPFDSVLVANRGEIARRILAAARTRGLRTVAVYSDADANAPHVGEADLAVRLPGALPADTYLRGELILAAAAATGAQAIHPGYGFLSENAEFAAGVAAAGLTWVGPSAAAIVAMGAKIEAKALLAKAGVPMLGTLDPDMVSDTDFPVLVKASAGGGGRGMRIVRSHAELPEALEGARREALAAFGDDAVFCERYLEHGRHIEVQIMADAHGTVWPVGERECSIQRRHQKVIEEAPSPLVERTEGMRERLFAAAVHAASAIEYRGAGTVEFLATDAGEFFFLEVNTRLQVEHPVTEATTGLDLVALQFDVAAGLPLPGPTPPPTNGWAIEARLYAEDPAHDFRPVAGRLDRFEVPHHTEFAGPSGTGVRLDSAVGVAGAEISVYYDPMLAKVIGRGSTRAEALRVTATALRRGAIHGITTNRDLLVRVLEDPDVRAGNFSTAFLTGERLAQLTRPLLNDDEIALAALAAGAVIERRAVAAGPLALVPPGWRNVGAPTYVREFRGPGEQIITATESARVVSAAGNPGDGHAVVVVESGGIRSNLRVSIYPGAAGTGAAEVDTANGGVRLELVPRLPIPESAARAGSLLAPMPGVITRVEAAPGMSVVAGQKLVWMEAMKMEHIIGATAAGIVADVPIAVGQNVTAGTVLAVLGEAPIEGAQV